MKNGRKIIDTTEPTQANFLAIRAPASKVVSKTYETMTLNLPLKKSLSYLTCNNLMTSF
jgi:hypothetical protein